MQEKLLKTTQAEYIPGVWDGKNTSGIVPVGDRVVVMPDVAADKSSGNVWLDPRAVERATMASESGVLVAIGEGAWVWNSDHTRPFEGRKPKIGERVTFQRYSGQLSLGLDNKLYRVMDADVIGGILTAEVNNV